MSPIAPTKGLFRKPATRGTLRVFPDFIEADGNSKVCVTDEYSLQVTF